MDCKTETSVNDCEQWVEALRALLKTGTGNRRRVRLAAEEALVKLNHVNNSLPVAFHVSGCGDAQVNGVYRTVQRNFDLIHFFQQITTQQISRNIIL